MRQRRGLLGFGALLLVLLEIVTFVLVAYAIGVLWAVLLVIATGILGGWLLRREGVRAWRSLRDSASSGQPVGAEAVPGVVGLTGALLLVVPGFLTDVVGLALLIPPVRQLAASGVRRFAERRLPSSTAGDLFGPRRVRVRPGTPSAPSAPGAQPPTGDVLEGEIIDPR
jgi:UPF0716 protein FxsA